MSFRTTKQLFLHIQSFRNIQLWYQGIYFLKLTICLPTPTPINFHPIYHTQSTPLAQPLYDSQIYSQAYIQNKTSTFVSKGFYLKYFQEEVQIGDMVSFRAEIQHGYQGKLQVSVGLWFFDSFKKDVKHHNLRQDSKQVRKVKYYIDLTSNNKSIHQYIPLSFPDQYFSLTHMTCHCISLSHHYRTSPVQLSQFANLSTLQKHNLLQKIKLTIPTKPISITQSLCKQLNIKSNQLIRWLIQLGKGQIRIGEELMGEYQRVRRNVSKEFKGSMLNDVVFDKEFMFGFVQDQHQMDEDQLEDKVIAVLAKINSLAVTTIRIWQKFINLLKINPRFVIAYYQRQYNHSQRLFYHQLTTTDILPSSSNIFLSHPSNTTTLLSNLNLTKQTLNFPSPIYQQKLFQKQLDLPLTIIQCYQKPQKLQKIQEKKKNRMRRQGRIRKEEDFQDQFQEGQEIGIMEIKQQAKQHGFFGIHLVVLVHGFQGTSYDMKLIKNTLAMQFPQTMFLCCTANQELTDTDIFQMGNRLAIQIKTHIIQNFPNNTLGRLSFIGHSLGGLKIRAALPLLLQYSNVFHSFLTLSSPHLGYTINTPPLIHAGLWLLQKMKQSQCLSQLTMTDNPIPEQTVLYRLSLSPGLCFFKQIFLYSSLQDSYAPYQSARIQIGQGFMNSQDVNKQIHCRMVKNLLKDVDKIRLRRVNVEFTIGENSLDAFIGRTAHILFLETKEVFRQLLSVEKDLYS